MRLLLKSCLGVLAALALLAVVLLVNTLRLPGLPVSSSRPAPPPADLDAASRRLSAAIQIPTVSAGPDAPDAADNFPAFHQLLASSFPLTHATLKRETVNGDSLLYTWQGSDPALPPMLLTAHMDTVPVEPGTEGKWTHAPFSGAIADGYVWGRGALDMKHAVMATLEGVEHLLAQGYRPRRTILLAFGADEEVGGARGAAKIVELLQQRRVHAWCSLDEGSVILDGFIPGAQRPIAQIGIAEKGSVSLALTAQADGGHSSMPPPLTAVGRIARAVARVEEQPMPASLDGPDGAGAAVRHARGAGQPVAAGIADRAPARGRAGHQRADTHQHRADPHRRWRQGQRVAGRGQGGGQFPRRAGRHHRAGDGAYGGGDRRPGRQGGALRPLRRRGHAGGRHPLGRLPRGGGRDIGRRAGRAGGAGSGGGGHRQPALRRGQRRGTALPAGAHDAVGRGAHPRSR